MMRLHLRGIFAPTLALLVFCGLGCSGNKGPIYEVPADAGGLLAVSEERLLVVDPARQTVRQIGTSPRLREVKALATDIDGLRVFALAESEDGAYLLRLDAETGAVSEIGMLTSEIPLNTADAMEFDPREQCLWVSAGSKGLSRFVLRVDPATGAGKRQGRVVGMPQGEVDGMALKQGVLYAVDHVPGESYFARLAPKIVRMTPVGTLPGEITDLTYDRTAGIFYAVAEGHLAVLNLETVGPEDEEKISLGPLSTIALDAITVLPPSSRIFGDGFETGDVSGWSFRSKGK
jgi:hypothetical protein